MKRTITVRVVVAVVILVFVAGTWVQDGQLNLGWLKFFSLAVLLAGLVLMVWDIWLWKVPLVQRVPGVPRNAHGTWKGVLTSFWVDPSTGSRPAPKPVYLVIRQTATKVSVKLLTDESRSSSSLATISQTGEEVFELIYVYINRPDSRVEHRSRMHHGSTVLDISGRPARRLRGRYWTDRDSKGELDFTARTKHIADDFDEAASFF